ncbi:MAG: chromosomal replication initiator protein DnaA [Clostridiales Family XIII bacterium]|jgi:chromosomal replication initiator protein|nr:chromosomal replication initiator protein DnaA [Clostridiales Family XIII bacterium]
MENISSVWEKTLEILQSELNPVSYETWIQPLRPVKTDAKKKIVYLTTNNEFIKSTLEKRYISVIEGVLSDVCDESVKVSVSLSEETAGRRKPGNEAQTHTGILSEENIPNPRYNFNTFVVGKNNHFAHAAAVAVAEDPVISEISKTAYNPLFIYGGAGLGKTHLMHAIWHHINQNSPRLCVLYVSSEMFTNELIKAIKEQKTFQFRNKYRNIDVLLIDDIQFIEKKESTQEEMFHTFNALYESNKQIIISSDRPPKNFITFSDRLRSRFEWGLVADIQVPDFETRVAILRNKAELDGHALTDDFSDVINLISEKIHSNIRELEGAMNRVVAHGNLLGRNIDRELVRETLKDIFSSKENQPSAADIKKQVCKYFSIKTSDIESSKRARKFSYPRQIAMYLCRKMTDLSLSKIGESFGNRDHTTILHAIEKITNEIKTNESLEDILSKLEEDVRNN